LSILDVGGTASFWQIMNPVPEGTSITLFNLELQSTSGSTINSVAGDARDMRQFNDTQFDVVFSNSVIEHVGTLEDQRLMANEIRRVGQGYFVQTPNYYFPIEPHSLFPGFQWLPLSTRSRLVQWRSWGWLSKISDPAEALASVEQIRLLKETELMSLFPDAKIWRETILGLTKSLVAIRPINDSTSA